MKPIYLKSINQSTAGIALLSCMFAGQVSGQEKDKPNVLMILVDDLNDWIGCMSGNPSVRTPNIDRLASKGMLFTNAHCQAPLSGPSRASLLTGLRPSTTGIYGMIPDDEISKASEATKDILFLPEYFAKNGYHTMGVGKIFHDHAPEGVFHESGGREKGFGPILPDGKRFHWKKGYTQTDWGAFPETDEEMPDYRTAQWAINQLGKKHSQPFFLAAGFLRPHVPWYVPQKWFDMYPVQSVSLPPYRKNDKDDVSPIAIEMDKMEMMPTTEWAIENNQWRNMVQAYLACISFVDHYIGEVLRALENSEYRDNTIVVLLSDNGYRLGGKDVFAKWCLWQEATKVPLIISYPESKKTGVCDVPAELLDVYPTLLDLCNLPEYKTNEGKSLKPFVMGIDHKSDYYAVSTCGRNNHAVVSNNYRYIRYEDSSEELYDHSSDPNEWFNIAYKPESSETKKHLQKKLPKINRLWSGRSEYNINDYFTKQREEQVELMIIK